MGNIKFIKSPGYTAGQMKFTGTGPGLKAIDTVGGGGGGVTAFTVISSGGSYYDGSDWTSRTGNYNDPNTGPFGVWNPTPLYYFSPPVSWTEQKPYWVSGSDSATYLAESRSSDPSFLAGFEGQICLLHNAVAYTGNTEHLVVTFASPGNLPVIFDKKSDNVEGITTTLASPAFIESYSQGNTITSLSYLPPTDADYDTDIQIYVGGVPYMLFFRGAA